MLQSLVKEMAKKLMISFPWSFTAKILTCITFGILVSPLESSIVLMIDSNSTDPVKTSPLLTSNTGVEPTTPKSCPSSITSIWVTLATFRFGSTSTGASPSVSSFIEQKVAEIPPAPLMSTWSGVGHLLSKLNSKVYVEGVHAQISCASVLPDNANSARRHAY